MLIQKASVAITQNTIDRQIKLKIGHIATIVSIDLSSTYNLFDLLN